MIGNDETRSPAGVVDDLEVLGELEARDLMELGGDEKGEDIPGDGSRSRLWLTLRIAALIMLGAVLVVAAVFRYVYHTEQPRVPVVNNGGLLEPRLHKPSAAPPVDPDVNDKALSEQMSELYYWRVPVESRYALTLNLGADGTVFGSLGNGLKNLSTLISVRGGRASKLELDTTGSKNRACVFGADGAPYLVVLDPETGISRVKRLDSSLKPVWTCEVEGRVDNLSTSTDGSRVYLGTIATGAMRDVPPRLTAVDGRGQLVYRIDLPERNRAHGQSSPNAYPQYIFPDSAGRVFIRGRNPDEPQEDCILALDAAGRRIYLHPLHRDELLAFADPLDLEETPLRYRNLQNRIQELLPVGDGRLVVTSCMDHPELGACQLLDAAGEVAWRVQTGESTEAGSSLTDDGRILVTHDSADYWGQRHRLAALDLESGERAWEFGVEHCKGFLAGPDGTVYLVNHTTDLIAIDRRGTVKWRYDRDGASPRLELRGALLFSLGNIIKAYQVDGIRNYELSRENCNAAVLGGDGTIYYSTREGEVVAMKNPLLQDL